MQPLPGRDGDCSGRSVEDKAGEKGVILTDIVYAEEGLSRKGKQRGEHIAKNRKTWKSRRPYLAYCGEKTG